MSLPRSVLGSAVVLAVLAGASDTARAQCPEEPRLDNFRGAGRVTCPCFVEGEEAGAVFSPPAGP